LFNISDEVICEYYGDLITDEDEIIEKIETGSSARVIRFLKKFETKNVYINGASFCPAVYINCNYDAKIKKLIKKENCMFYQKADIAEIADFGDSDAISIISTRKITIGEEFIINYGESFDYSKMDTQIIQLSSTPEKKPKKREVVDVDEFISTQYSQPQMNLSQTFIQNTPMDLDMSNFSDENFTEVDKSIEFTQNLEGLTALTQEFKEELNKERERKQSEI
jgi:hypothetical protein